jgi:phage/plasmid-associated DNA primase
VAIRQHDAIAIVSPQKFDLKMIQMSRMLAATRRNSKGLRTKDIYDIYIRWSDENGFRRMSNVSFGKKLRGLGFEQRKSGNDLYWNLKWKQEAPQQPSVSPMAGKYIL